MFICEICNNKFDDKRHRECKQCSKEVCEYCMDGEYCEDCKPEEEDAEWCF